MYYITCTKTTQAYALMTEQKNVNFWEVCLTEEIYMINVTNGIMIMMMAISVQNIIQIIMPIFNNQCKFTQPQMLLIVMQHWYFQNLATLLRPIPRDVIKTVPGFNSAQTAVCNQDNCLLIVANVCCSSGNSKAVPP